MTNEQKIRNLAVKFTTKSTFAYRIWQGKLSSYGYEDEPDTIRKYVKRLKYGELSEALWLLSEIAIPNNDKFKFLDIETIEVDGIGIDLVKIGKQFFKIEVEKFHEYKPKKKIIYVLEKCND